MEISRVVLSSAREGDFFFFFSFYMHLAECPVQTVVETQTTNDAIAKGYSKS